MFCIRAFMPVEIKLIGSVEIALKVNDDIHVAVGVHAFDAQRCKVDKIVATTVRVKALSPAPVYR